MRAAAGLGALVSVLKWPVFGALFAGGALIVADYIGPEVARELGGDAGAGFAEGMNRVRSMISGEVRPRGRARGR